MRRTSPFVPWVLVSLCASAAQAQLTVDDFSADQAGLQLPPGTDASSSVSDPGILGGGRDLRLRHLGGGDVVTAEVTGGVFVFTSGAGTSGEAHLLWDGLGGVDLTAATALRLSVAAATPGAVVVAEVFSDPARSSVAARAPSGAGDVVFPFASFVANRGAGADFADVDSIRLVLRGEAVSVSLELVETGASSLQVTATKTDSVSSARPGETLQYTVRIQNTATETAAGVELADTLDANTTLVSGSIEVSPLARDDFYTTTMAALNVPAPGILTNDLDADGDALGITAPGTSAAGGTVMVQADGSFTYTPPAGLSAPDTFGYTIDDGNGIPDSALVVMTIADLLPTVTATSPVDGATGQLSNVELSITLSEPVDVSGNWFQIVCTGSGTRNVSDTMVTGGPTTFGIDPLTDFDSGDDCTVTVFASQVSDQDGNDPPDGLLADYLFAFDVDAGPSVAATSPVDGATGQASDIDLSITFSEPVDVTGNWFQIVCTSSGARNVSDTVVTGGPTAFGIDPAVDFAFGESCTVTVFASQVSDQDGNDPPDGMSSNHELDFTVDAAPSVTSTAPSDGATSVARTATITVSFSESVNATTSSFALECPSGTPLTYTLSASPSSSFVLTPSANLPAGELCEVTVVASEVTDADSGDPPDGMAVDHSFDFQVEAVANDDGYDVSPHLTLNISSGMGVRANDDPTTIAITGFGADLGSANGTVPDGTNTVTTASNGVVRLAADGSFTYFPPPDVSNATDRFFYTILGGDTAEVTLSIQNQGLIWFVDGSYGGGNGMGDGTQARPFTALTDLGAASDNANDTIFVRQGSYACGHTLLDGQKLFGDGSSSDLQTLSGVTPVTGSSLPAFTGTAPVLSSAATCLTLGVGNTMRGAAIVTTLGGATGISGSAFGTFTALESSIAGTGRSLSFTNGTLGATFTSLTSTGSTTNGITLSSVGGMLVVNDPGGVTTAISGSTGAAVSVSGGTVSLTYNGAISESNNAPLVSVGGGHATGTLTFQNGTLGATNGTGLQFDNADGTYNFLGTNTLNGGDAGIDIVNGSGGAFSFSSNTTITNPSGTAFRVNGGGGSVTYPGTIGKSSAGRLVDVQGRSGGTLTLSGNLTCNTSCTGIQVASNTGGTVSFSGGTKTLSTGVNPAVTLTSNTGATIEFTNGGLDIDTASGMGFNATGGGIVTVTGTENTITSGTGTAVSVAGTTIGAGGLTWQSISSNGAASGIVLNGTGSSGRLSVTGDGGTCSSAATCTGGAIQNTVGDGISLTNTRNVSLTRMFIGDTGRHGVLGTTMTDITGGAEPTFEIRNSYLSSPGDADNESALYFDTLGATNITGRMVVAGTSIVNFEDVGIHVGNSSGTLTIDVTDVIISNNSDINGEEGIDVAAEGTANITLNVTGTRTGAISTTMFTDLEGGGINAIAQNNGILEVNLSGIVDIGTGGPDNFPTPPAWTFAAEGSGSTFTFDITNNRIVDSSGDGIFIGHEGRLEGGITGNTVSGLALGDAIRIDTDTTSNTTSTILIENNDLGNEPGFLGIGDDGIQVLHRDGTKVLNLTIRNNRIANTASEGIRYFADDDIAGGGPGNVLGIFNNQFAGVGDPNTIVVISQDPGTDVCANITGNTGVSGITLQQSLSALLQIAQASTAALSAANGGATATVVGTVTFNGTCTTPPQPSNP